MDKGLSCSDKDGVFLLGFAESVEDLGGDFEELQEMVNLIVGICLNGEVKKMGLFVSKECPVNRTSISAERVGISRIKTEKKTRYTNMMRYRIKAISNIICDLI